MTATTTGLHGALEAVAGEIDRWGAYAHAAFDDALVRHHVVRERVRRVERSAALVAASVVADGDMLRTAGDLLGTVRSRAREVGAELTRQRTDLIGLGEATAEVRQAFEDELGANLESQRRLATVLAAQTRAGQLARTVLHDALERQRTLPRFARAARRSAAAQALTAAEAAAHDAAAELDTTTGELAGLRRRHQQIVAAIATLDAIAGEISADRRLVDDGLHELGICGEQVEVAEQAERRAHDALQRASDGALSLAEAARAARSHLGSADTGKVRLDAAYEAAQQVAVDAGLLLRDVLSGSPTVVRSDDG